MNQFKKAKVVLLPTNEIVNALKGYTDKSLLFKYAKEYNSIPAEYDYVSFFHLYIISDNEIKEGDWFLSDSRGTKQEPPKYRVEQCIKVENGWIFGHIEGMEVGHNPDWSKQIITTTDTSLEIVSKGINPVYEQLPQPSQQFIEKYIEEYNKGNIIIDVLVEYEQDYTNRSCSTCNLGTDGTCELKLEKKCCSNTNNVTKHGDYWISCLDEEEDSEIYKIKINPKDNTITIKKLKDSWNRKEIVVLLNKLNNTLNIGSDLTLEEWINKNL